jgi:hypothetical protein
MKLFHSIRTKLTLWYTALLGIMLLSFGTLSYFFTKSTLSDNLDLSLHSEVKWVNEFIGPKAKKVRLKRSALLELQQLKKSAAAPAESEQISTDSAAVDEIWNQIYQHTILSPRRQYIQILDRNGDLLYRSPSLGKQSLQFADIPYGWIKLVTTYNDEGRELRIASTQNDYVNLFDLPDSCTHCSPHFHHRRVVSGPQIAEACGRDYEDRTRDQRSKFEPAAAGPGG